jgi:hypothetical protein
VTSVVRTDAGGMRGGFSYFWNYIIIDGTGSVVQWSAFLALDPEVLDSIPSTTKFSEKQRVYNGFHSAL